MKNITIHILTKSYSSTKVLALGLLLLSGLATAQTINNPDFEILTTAGTYPTGVSQVSRAAGWMSPTTGAAASTSDYFYGPPNGSYRAVVNTGSTVININAQSGAAYAGGYAELTGNNYKEYLTNTLSTKLTAGVTYKITFYVLHLYGIGYFDLLPAEQGFIGLCFSAAAPTNSDVSNVNSGGAGRGGILNSWNPTKRALIPASNTSVYGAASRNIWVPVTLTYTADGTEQYMTVGQFRETVTNGNDVYYLYDNFSMTACAAGTTAPDIN